MQVKASQAVRMIIAAIKARVVPIMKGSPAIGKSAIVRQVAREYNLKVIDLRLSQCDPTDLAGFPTIIEGRKADYMPMAHFPIEGDLLPINLETGLPYAGWILFLDEMTSAPPAIQAASYKLALDRMVGSHHIHKNCAIVGAGNLETDGAIVYTMSTALQSRLLHFELICDVKEWNDWATAHGIDYRITSYMNYKPGCIYTFSPDHTDCTYASPRTWEFADRILKATDEGSADRLPLLAGAISEGVAREFMGFMKIHEELLTPAQIIAKPETVKVPSEPSILFALTGSIAHNMDLHNGDAFMKFVSRLPVEFQVVCLRESIRRNKDMMGHKSIQKWIADSATSLF